MLLGRLLPDLVEVDVGRRLGRRAVRLLLGLVVRDELVDDLRADEQVELGLRGACAADQGRRERRGPASVRGARRGAGESEGCELRCRAAASRTHQLESQGGGSSNGDTDARQQRSDGS